VNTLLRGQYKASFWVAEIKDDEEGVGEMLSVSGLDLGSTTQQGLQRTGTDGEVSYVPPIFQQYWRAALDDDDDDDDDDEVRVQCIIM